VVLFSSLSQCVTRRMFALVRSCCLDASIDIIVTRVVVLALDWVLCDIIGSVIDPRCPLLDPLRPFLGESSTRFIRGTQYPHQSQKRNQYTNNVYTRPACRRLHAVPASPQSSYSLYGSQQQTRAPPFPLIASQPWHQLAQVSYFDIYVYVYGNNHIYVSI